MPDHFGEGEEESRGVRTLIRFSKKDSKADGFNRDKEKDGEVFDASLPAYVASGDGRITVDEKRWLSGAQGS